MKILPDQIFNAKVRPPSLTGKMPDEKTKLGEMQAIEEEFDSANPPKTPEPFTLYIDKGRYDKLTLENIIKETDIERIIEVDSIYGEYKFDPATGKFLGIFNKYDVTSDEFINVLQSKVENKTQYDSREDELRAEMEFTYYIDYFAKQVNEHLSSPGSGGKDKQEVVNKMKDLLKEMADSPMKSREDYETKFNISGVEFTVDELLKAEDIMSCTTNHVFDKSKKGYMNFAALGISTAFVRENAKSFNEDQADLLNSQLKRKIDEAVSYGDRAYVGGELETDEERAYYYKYKEADQATNMELRNHIFDMFASIDISDTKALDQAAREFTELMKPMYIYYHRDWYGGLNAHINSEISCLKTYASSLQAGKKDPYIAD